MRYKGVDTNVQDVCTSEKSETGHYYEGRIVAVGSCAVAAQRAL